VFSAFHILQDKVFSAYFIILPIKTFYYSFIILSNLFKVTEKQFLN